MITTIKTIYELFSATELEKSIPKTKISNINKSFKITFVFSNGVGELLYFENNKIKNRINFNSRFYEANCNINVAYFDINGEFTIEKRIVEEFLNENS